MSEEEIVVERGKRQKEKNEALELLIQHYSVESQR